jgi:hypothetical protein
VGARKPGYGGGVVSLYPARRKPPTQSEDTMTAMTVAEVYESISERHNRTRDFKVRSNTMRFAGSRAVAYQTGDNPLWPSSVESAGLNDRAFYQLADRFAVPPKWAMDDGACPPELRSTVFNWKFANVEDKAMLLRTVYSATEEAETRSATLRAVLSDRYQPYDNIHLWEAVMAALGTIQLGSEPKVILRSEGDELRGYLLFDGVQFDTGDTPTHTMNRSQDGGGSGGLHPAVYFGNSEVGTGRVRIASGLFRSYCSNGMIYGWKEEGTLAITHLWSERNHIALAVHEGIANALTLSEEAAGKMLEAMDHRVEPTKLDGIFDRWSEKYGITVKSKDAWKAMVRGEATLFDVVNAATVIAHDIKNAEEVENVERMAGDMLQHGV